VPRAVEQEADDVRGAEPVGARAPADYTDVVDAFREVSEAITEDTKLDDLLHLVARKICELLRIQRCSVYLSDPETGLFQGQVAHTGEDEDAAIKRLTAGIEADGFTHEIVATKRPVLIADTQSDPRPVRSAMVRWGIRRMLGVPMIGSGQQVIGILYLDNREQPHDYTKAEQELAAAFANLAAVAISQIRTASELRKSLRTVARQNAILRRTAAMDDRLASAALGGASLHDIASLVADILDKPCAIYDAEHRRLALGHRDDDQGVVPQVFENGHREQPEVAAALASVETGRATVIGPLPSAGLPHRYLIAPVVVRDEQWGTLVAMEFGSQFSALDVAAAKRAATIIALEMSAERRVVDADAYARVSFVRDLISATDAPETLLRRARAHGLDLTRPHVVCVMRSREGRELSAADVEAGAAMVAPDLGRCAAVVDTDLVLILEVDPEQRDPAAAGATKDVVKRVCARLGRSDLLAAISAPCRQIADVQRGFDEARQIVALLEPLVLGGAEASVLTATELGPARLFLGSADRPRAIRFAEDTLGPLLAEGGELDPLLVTLRAFIESGRSVRHAAERLGVHENTIRYRLVRLLDITGLDVQGNADQQLAAQIALLILRFEQRLPHDDRL
jgi:GAF domain-containing protein